MRLAVMTVDSVTQIDVFRSLSYQVVIESHGLMCLDLWELSSRHRVTRIDVFRSLWVIKSLSSHTD